MRLSHGRTLWVHSLLAFSTAAALLAERGELDLDASLSTHLPALRMTPPLSPDSITLRHLLTHTHGIDAGGPVTFRTAFSGEFTNEQLVDILATYKPAANGRVFRYGNLGYNIAGVAMDATLGVGWKDVLEQEVFVPLGMSSTTAYRSRADEAGLAMPYATSQTRSPPLCSERAPPQRSRRISGRGHETASNRVSGEEARPPSRLAIGDCRWQISDSNSHSLN